MTEYGVSIIVLISIGTLALIWGSTVLWRATGT